MSATLDGLVEWYLDRDKDGHRDYTAIWQVSMSDVEDGPLTAMSCPGLPAIGSYWAIGNDLDLSALCWPNWKVRPVVKKERQLLWTVEQTFTTKPLSRCQDSSIENPLDEPPTMRGSFQRRNNHACKNRHGVPIKSSSHELIKGKQTEFDDNTPTVQIGMNLIYLPLTSFSSMIQHVNDSEMWGLDRRMVKLSNAVWERKIYGTCSYYFTVMYDFDINYRTFDRRIYDEGTKVLSPGGDPENPAHFVLYKDANGDNTKVFLNGAGEAVAADEDPAEIEIEYYEEANFFSLGIPAVLDG